MTSLLNYLDSLADPRTKDWFLVKSPITLATLIVGYLYFCNKAGPQFMKDRKPYNLKHVIIVYNIFQVLLSVYLVYEGLVSGWLNEYSYKCQPVDYSNSTNGLRMANAVWMYYMCKVIELLDTVFFVLRKKNRQISFLHLYHHSMMLVCAWIGVRYLPGGHGTFLGVINSFIHIIMYAYYLISSLGPEYQKYLWWKRHLTALQMVQFCFIFVHSGQLLFRDCNYPKFIAFLLTTQALVFLYMFGSFYVRNYLKSKSITINETAKLQTKTE